MDDFLSDLIDVIVDAFGFRGALVVLAIILAGLGIAAYLS